MVQFKATITGSQGLNAFLKAASNDKTGSFDPPLIDEEEVTVQAVRPSSPSNCFLDVAEDWKNYADLVMSAREIALENYNYIFYIYDLPGACEDYEGFAPHDGNEMHLFSYDPDPRVINHEFGHSLGISHSGLSAEYLNNYGGPNQPHEVNLTYGDHTTAMGNQDLKIFGGFHKSRLSWITSDKILTIVPGSNQEVTLENSNQISHDLCPSLID